MEQADILYDDHGLTILDTSEGIVVEFADGDIRHGFSISHDKVGDPSVWQSAVDNLVEWTDAGDGETLSDEEIDKAMGFISGVGL
jgi:hypothetical protein